MKLSHTKLIVFSGIVWLAVGFYLLQLGLNLLIESVQGTALGLHYPIIKSLTPYMGTAEAVALFLVVLALFIGYFKGKFVLGKSARQGTDRIRALPNPAHIKDVYAPKYYILLAVMMALGISIKYFGLSSDIRGLIDTAIGAALINGAVVYFRLAQATNAQG